MTAVPRILAIMGSGETAPTMAKVHRLLASRAGTPPVPAVLLDTPYGFQENADELTAKAQEYFREQIGMPAPQIAITIASSMTWAAPASAAIRVASHPVASESGRPTSAPKVPGAKGTRPSPPTVEIGRAHV